MLPLVGGGVEREHASRVELGQLARVDADTLQVVQHEVHLLQRAAHGRDEVVADRSEDDLRRGLFGETSTMRREKI